MKTITRTFGIGDLFGFLMLVTVAYAAFGRILHQSGRIAGTTYDIVLGIAILNEFFILVAVVVVFRDGG